MTQRRRLLALLPLTGVAACAGRTAPIRQGVADFAGNATLATRAAQIRRAGEGRGWAIVDRAPGWSRGTLRLRGHEAVVDIRYDTRRFVIDYVSSVDLNHSGAGIHPNYNSWVGYLTQDIVAQSLQGPV